MKKDNPNKEIYLQTVYPAVDEEYFQMVDCLTAADEASDEEFVAVELGARYGTWITKAAFAYKHLHPKGKVHIVGVEPERSTFIWMKQHMIDNNIESYTLYNNTIAESRGKVVNHFYETGEITKAQTITVGDILDQFKRVDYMDIDIQGYESMAFGNFMKEMNEKVWRIHIGLHSPIFDVQIKKMFSENGWTQTWDFPTAFDLGFCDTKVNHMNSTACHQRTPYGHIVFRDGAMGWLNPRLKRN